MLLYWPPRQDVLNGLNGHDTVAEQLLADWILELLYRSRNRTWFCSKAHAMRPWNSVCMLILWNACAVKSSSKHQVSTHRVRLLSALIGETSFRNEKQLTERWIISWRGENECSALNKASTLTTLSHSISGNIWMMKWEECRSQETGGVLWSAPSRWAAGCHSHEHTMTAVTRLRGNPG